jgi:hypothetical protein
MHAQLEDWKNGWYGLELRLSRAEIDSLTRSLELLKKDPDQHFHISSDYAGAGGIGDILICRKGDAEPDNMLIGSVALPPGTSISTSRSSRET